MRHHDSLREFLDYEYTGWQLGKYNFDTLAEHAQKSGYSFIRTNDVVQELLKVNQEREMNEREDAWNGRKSRYEW